MLDLIIISKFHVGSITPTVKIQADVSLACNLTSAFAGLAYFVCTTSFRRAAHVHDDSSTCPSFLRLLTLFRPGIIFFIESAVRNGLYLWLIHGIVGLGTNYATALGVFSTIRWGLIMVPVMALEATTLTFIGHSWGRFRAITTSSKPRVTASQVFKITCWAMYSIVIVLIIEVPLCLIMSFAGAKPFAR